MSLRARIIDEIRRRGAIPFSRYMELCLYDPELGYYSRSREQFGKAGDFYTSSDVHAVFGRLLARQFEEMWRALDAPIRLDIIELGPGRGLFAQDVLDWSKKKFPDFFEATHYTLVESSPSLRARLQERFSDAPRLPDAGRRGIDAPDGAPSMPGSSTGSGQVFGKCGIATGPASKVSICSSLDELKPVSNVIVFANEFFDALPVEVISSAGELRLGVEADRFVETFVAPTAPELEFLDRYSVHPAAGERTEAALIAADYMRRIAGMVERGFVVLIDYGHTREELLAGRAKSTVRAFRQHAISATPYEAPGEQDITANVNFTALREAGLAAGLAGQAIRTQSQFLMGIGEANQFADAFEDVRLPQEHAKVALQLKHLVTPAGMGEIFQVLVMSRGVEEDKTLKLSGLRYGCQS